MQDHRDHLNYFKSNLSPQNLRKMAKSDLVELTKNLWASHVWKNKDWNINQIIEKNGFDKFRNLNSMLSNPAIMRIRSPPEPYNIKALLYQMIWYVLHRKHNNSKYYIIPY